jgi:uncharacterized protein YecE (DUF72 family)
VPRFAALMRRFGAAIAVSESPDWPCIEELTASFVYLRLHGSRRTYVSQYTDAELARWAERVRAWQLGGEPADARRISDRKAPKRKARDVYVYFDNDTDGHAPRDALRLKTKLDALR